MPFQASPTALYHSIIYLSVQLKGFPSRSMKQHRAFYLTRSKLRGLHDTSTYIKPPVETGKSTWKAELASKPII